MATLPVVFCTAVAVLVLWATAVPTETSDITTVTPLPLLKLVQQLPSNKTEKVYIASSVLYAIGILDNDDSDENGTDVSTERVAEKEITIFPYPQKNETNQAKADEDSST
ncbi:uncharacterized protein [Anabrus simplex]|uniref:uncharacterized protein n=1 Tax=Anabrus simplex TaxID=316456 RepID=UPI0034DD684F